MTAMGHEDQFPVRPLTARSVIGKRTVGASPGNGQEAPIAVVQRSPGQRARSTLFGFWVRGDRDS